MGYKKRSFVLSGGAGGTKVCIVTVFFRKGHIMQQNKGFFAGLFDLSFTEFITLRIIKCLFILAIIGSGIFALVVLVSLINEGGINILFAFIAAPIVFFLYILGARMWLELIIVLFRIADNTTQLVEQGKSESTPDSE